MGKLSEFRKARPTSSLTGEVMIKANDIEVLFGNNTYVVRFVDEQIHILIPPSAWTSIGAIRTLAKTKSRPSSIWRSVLS
jgi:hypothetical protein